MSIRFTYEGGELYYCPGQSHGPIGARRRGCRWYWQAWAKQGGDDSPEDCFPGVMNDFGTLVPVPLTALTLSI